EALHKAQHILVGFFVVHPDALIGDRQLVAQDALHYIEVVMDQHRRRTPLGFLPHLEPQVVEEHHVGAQLFLAPALARGAHNVAAGNSRAVGLQNPFQTEPLFVARNLARDADVVHRRHVHQEAAGQGDVRGDARALLPQRLLGDLHDDLLPFLEQIADGRQRDLVAARIRPGLRPAFRPAFGTALGPAFGPLYGAFTRALLPRTRFALRTTLPFRRGTAIAPSLAAGAARNTMRITSALFAQGGGQAGRDACRFRPFVFHDRHSGLLFGRFAFRRRRSAFRLSLGFGPT